VKKLCKGDNIQLAIGIYSFQVVGIVLK